MEKPKANISLRGILLWAAVGALLGVLLAAFSGTAHGQTFVTTQPDCIVFFHFTAAGQTSPTSPNAGFDNRTTACDTWNMTYASSGFSAISLEVQSAPNAAGSPGSYSTGFAVQQSIMTGSNPATNTTGGFLWVVGYGPWVRVTLASKTGTGIVDGALYGWRIPSASTSSGGSSNVTIVAPLGQTTMSASLPVTIASDQSGGANTCDQKAIFTTSGSGNLQIVAASGSTTIRVCHVDFSGDTLTTTKLTSGTGSNCGTGTANETGVFTGIGGAAAFAMDYASPLPVTAAKALCINLTVASAGGGTVLYSQR